MANVILDFDQLKTETQFFILGYEGGALISAVFCDDKLQRYSAAELRAGLAEAAADCPALTWRPIPYKPESGQVHNILVATGRV